MRIEFTFGKGEKATQKVVDFDPEDITLGFLEDIEEAQATGKWGPIRNAIADLLSLTHDESRQITMRQFKAIGDAIREASEAQQVPKA